MAMAQLPRLMRDADRLISVNRWWIELIGRRAPGVTRAQVEAALAPDFARVVGELPKGDPETVRVVAHAAHIPIHCFLL